MTCIVDLVAEFPAPRRTRLLPGYRCFPVLDGGVPPDATRFLGLIEELRDHREGILIHCDAGRGRAPTTAAALLIARGLAHEANDAFEMIRARRPIAAPTRSDRVFLTQLTPALRAQATLVSSDHRHGGRLA